MRLCLLQSVLQGKNGLDPLPCIEAKLNNTMWQGCVTFILSDMEKNRHKDFRYAVKYVFENMESESGLKDIITSGVVVDMESALCLCRRFFVMTHPLDTDLLFSCIKSDHAAVWKSALKQLFTEAMEKYRPCGDCRDVYKPYLTAYSLFLLATDSSEPDPVSLLMSNERADNILGAQVISEFVSICLGEMMPYLEGIAAAGLEACVNVTGRLRDLFKETGDFIIIKALSDIWVSYGGDEKLSEKSLAVSDSAEKAISEDMVIRLAEMVDNSEDIFLDTWELSMDNSREMINADATATLIATLGAMPFSEKLFKDKIKNLNSYAFIRGQFKYLGDLWMIERVGSAFSAIYVYRDTDRFLDIWEAVVGDVVRLKECGKRSINIYRLQSRFLKEKGWVRQVPVTKMV